MNTVIFGSIASLIFIALIKYREHKEAEALSQRWELVNYISETATENKNLSAAMISMLTESMDKHLLPKLIWATFISIISRNFKNDVKKFNDEIASQKSDKDIFSTAFRKMMKVNFTYAPYWYIFFGLIALIMLAILVLFMKAGKAMEKMYAYQQQSYLSVATR